MAEERMEMRWLTDADGKVVTDEDGNAQAVCHRIDVQDKGPISEKDCDDEIERFEGRIADAKVRKAKIAAARAAMAPAPVE